MRKVKGGEAEVLRYHLLVMVFAHVLFVILECFVYKFMFMMMITEIFYAWLCYQGFMTMNKLFIYGYVVCMFLTPIGILRIFDVGLGFSTLLFIF